MVQGAGSKHVHDTLFLMRSNGFKKKATASVGIDDERGKDALCEGPRCYAKDSVSSNTASP